jgi:hypothetical protein
MEYSLGMLQTCREKYKLNKLSRYYSSLSNFPPQSGGETCPQAPIGRLETNNNNIIINKESFNFTEFYNKYKELKKNNDIPDQKFLE